ncbi:MAG: hypothetical protein V3T86_08665 [Planctomycetota bacterium]
MTRLTWFLTALLAIAAAARADDDGLNDTPPNTPNKALTEALAAAIDLPTPKERRAAADDLAKREVTLDQWRAAMKGLRPRAAAEEGQQFESARLVVDGKREETDLHYYVPRDYDPEAKSPLMLGLHGSGGEGTHQMGMWRRVADSLGMIVVAPTEAGANVGYGFSRRERAAALAALRWARRRFHIDENRIYVTGVSRGGHLSWDLALRHPDLWAGCIPMIGGPRITMQNGQNNLRYLDNVVHLPIRDLQGSGDHPLLLANLRWAFQQLKHRHAADAKLIEFPELGHSFEFGAVEWVDWLDTAVRLGAPATVRRAVANKTGTRSFWLEIVRTDRKVRETFTPQVPAREWAAMSEAQKRGYRQRQIDERTASLTVTMTARGRFEAKGRLVGKFRILLEPEMWAEGRRVEIRFKGKTYKKTVKPSVRILLREFVERFDREFLPVAVVTVP